MTSAYILDIRRQAREALLRDPNGVRNAQTGIRNFGTLQPWLQRTLHQPGFGFDGFSIEQGHLLAWFDAQMQTGKLLVTRHRVPRGAFPDRMVAENQSILDGLHPDFDAGFNPETVNENDGWVSFRNPPACDRLFMDDDGWLQHAPHVAIPEETPEGVPLEVGSTRIETVWNHVVTQGGVARLPYDSDVFVVLVWSGWIAHRNAVWARMGAA